MPDEKRSKIVTIIMSLILLEPATNRLTPTVVI